MPVVFICHASEDKAAFVRPFAEALREAHVEVWYDEFQLEIGASLREAIDRGLAEADYGVVVLSKNFFQKAWPRRELNGLVARQMNGRAGLVLPIWHGIDQPEILRHSPPLADLIAIKSSLGIDKVVAELLHKIRPQKSPLIVAQEHLEAAGVEPLSVTDDLWLDVAEAKESVFRFPGGAHRWIFPLPYPKERTAAEKGANLASTYLQMDWEYEAEQLGLSHLTPPEQVHEFLRTWSGLLETAQQHPDVLAIYTPQLTIPGFDQDLEPAFDSMLLGDDGYEWRDLYSRGKWPTRDGERPLCGELIAWRHPSFGNYTPERLADKFVRVSRSDYRRDYFNTFECLTWLLSDASSWLPEALREVLIEGMRARDLWRSDLVMHGQARGPFCDRLYSRRRVRKGIAKRVRDDAVAQFSTTLAKLGFSHDAEAVADRFFQRGFVEAVEEYDLKVRELRNAR